MNRIEDILASCISDVKAGKATLESCLRRYPSVRDKIEPLLKTALSIQEPSDVRPSGAFKIKARVQLLESIHAEKAARESLFHRFGRALFQTPLIKSLAASFIIILVIVSSGTATAYASQGSLPGEFLYTVKLGTEQLRRMLASNNVAGVELELSFAETRLREIERITGRGLDIPEMSISQYEKNIQLALEEAKQNKDNLALVKLELVSSAMLQHLSLLDSLEDTSPELAGEAARQCQEFAVIRQAESLVSLAQYNPVKATEINILAQRNRLQRAVESAGTGQALRAENALRQFTQLCSSNERISQIAKRTGYETLAIDTLNKQSLHDQMEALSNIEGKVSGVVMMAARRGIGLQPNSPTEESPGNNSIIEPPSGPEEPGNSSVEPGSSPGEPGSSPGEPGNGPGEPGSGPGEPGNGPGEPGNGPGEPGSGPGEPGSGPGEPGSGPGEPGNRPN